MSAPERSRLPAAVKAELERHLSECGGCQRGAGEEHTFEWTPTAGLRPGSGFGQAEIASFVLRNTLDHYLQWSLVDHTGKTLYVLLLPGYQVGALKEYLAEHFPDVK